MCLHVSNFLQACNSWFPTSFYGVAIIPWPGCSFFWPLIMSMLKREYRIGYMLKNVIPHTAIFEMKCLPWAYQKGHAMIFFSFLPNCLILACSYGTLCGS